MSRANDVRCPVHDEPLTCTVDEQELQIRVGCARCDAWLGSAIQPHTTVAEIEWYVRVLADVLLIGIRKVLVPSSDADGGESCVSF